VKIKFKTTACGPVTSLNFNGGDVADLPNEIAKTLIKAGAAVPLANQQIKTATVTPEPETRKTETVKKKTIKKRIKN